MSWPWQVPAHKRQHHRQLRPAQQQMQLEHQGQHQVPRSRLWRGHNQQARALAWQLQPVLMASHHHGQA